MTRYIKTLDGVHEIESCFDCPLVGCPDLKHMVSSKYKSVMSKEIVKYMKEGSIHESCPLPRVGDQKKCACKPELKIID